MSFRPPDDLAPLLGALPRGLYSHVARVVAEADRLADLHGLNRGLACRAAWAHDVARAMPEAELLSRALEYGLTIKEEERAAPVLLHGPVGAEILHREFGWEEGDMLNAVRYHTTGRPGMSPLEMLVLLADKIEPAKLTDEEIKRVRAAALENLEAGARLFYSWHQRNNVSLDRSTHPLALSGNRWLTGD